MAGDVAGLFGRYADRYMAGDAETVADMYAAPFLAVRGGVPIHLGDRAQVVEHLAGLMAAYVKAGAAAAEIIEIDVLAQGNVAALATVHWNVRAADGALVRDFRTSYQLVDAGDTWQIVSYVNHDQVAG